LGARTGRLSVKLLLDHHYSPAIARLLRDRGFDVVAANEVGLEVEPDEGVLEFAVAQQRALLTNDVPGFMRIRRDWQAEGRTHFGLLFTSDSTWSRSKKGIGPLTARLEDVLQAKAGVRALEDQIVWL